MFLQAADAEAFAQAVMMAELLISLAFLEDTPGDLVGFPGG